MKKSSQERIFISFFAGEKEEDMGGVFRENLVWDGGWNDRMHRAAVKKAKELGAKSYVLFKPMRMINVQDYENEKN